MQQAFYSYHHSNSGHDWTRYTTDIVSLAHAHGRKVAHPVREVTRQDKFFSKPFADPDGCGKVQHNIEYYAELFHIRPDPQN